MYDRCSRKLYNYALWIVQNRQACDDIIQTAFIKAWNEPGAPTAEKEIEAWLYMVTRNLCMDFFRKSSRFSRFRAKYALERRDFAENSAENRMLWELLDRLSEKEKSIIYLHLRSGYSYREIADLVDSTETAVRVQAFRAIKKLRKSCARELL